MISNVPRAALRVSSGPSISQSPPKKQNQPDGEREEEIYDSQTIMETQKSQDLLPASWGPRKAHGVGQSTSEGWRTGSTDVRGQKKIEVSAQAEKVNLPSLHLLVFFKIG